jgi:glucan phosphoethanolaminetransferase (alkaline phosphatase superfamily)
MHAERERRERQLRLLVLLLVILAVIPRQFVPITLWYNYLDVMFSTKEDVSGEAYLLSALIAAVVLAILLIYIARFILWKLPLSRSASRWHPPLTVKLLATAPLVVVSSSLLVQFSAFWRPDDFLDYYDNFHRNFYGVAGVACTIGLGVALALVWVTVQGIRRAAQSHAEESQNQSLP